MMLKTQAKERVEKLKESINKYRYHRLVLDKPLISESAEDSLKKELFDLEQEFPDLVTLDSPTQRVGGKPLSKFKKFEHPKSMLSFNDTFSESDMEDWLDRVARVLGVAVSEGGPARLSFTKEKLGGFYVELKLDGLAIELVYKNGIL